MIYLKKEMIRPSVFMLVTETISSGKQHFSKMLCVGNGMCYGSHYIIPQDVAYLIRLQF